MEFDRHTFYIAASYAMLVVAILIEIFAVRRRRALARQQATMMSAVQASQPNSTIASEAS